MPGLGILGGDPWGYESLLPTFVVEEEPPAEEVEVPEEKGKEPPPEGAGESQFAAECYAKLAPLTGAEATYGFPLRALMRAVGSMFQQVEDAIRAKDGLDAYSQTFDVERTPDWLIPFVGQAVGVKVTPGLPPAEQRQQVREESGWARGRPAAIVSAVERTLTGTKEVRLTERAGTPYQVLVVTRPEETPDVEATERAGREQKPGGLIMTFVQSDSPLIDEAPREIDAATEGTIDTATLAQVS